MPASVKKLSMGGVGEQRLERRPRDLGADVGVGQADRRVGRPRLQRRLDVDRQRRRVDRRGLDQVLLADERLLVAELVGADRRRSGRHGAATNSASAARAGSSSVVDAEGVGLVR